MKWSGEVWVQIRNVNLKESNGLMSCIKTGHLHIETLNLYEKESKRKSARKQVGIAGHKTDDNCWPIERIGIKPGDKVIGLSKFARVADWVFSRPHIQEEAVMILADEIEQLCKPKGLGIIIKAQHYCMKWRGVKEPDTSMINSVVRGDFRHDPNLKQEFFELVRQQSTVGKNY